jgi:hypothetical protein
LALDKVLHRVEEAEIPQINADIAKGYEKIDNIEDKMTELRIKFAELASPGHPTQRSSMRE